MIPFSHWPLRRYVVEITVYVVEAAADFSGETTQHQCVVGPAAVEEENQDACLFIHDLCTRILYSFRALANTFHLPELCCTWFSLPNCEHR